MALRSIAPFSCTPLLRRFPATATTPVASRAAAAGGGRSCRPTQSNEDHRLFKISPSISPLRARVLQSGAELGSVRAASISLTGGQGAVEGEESVGTIPKSRVLILYSKPGCCLCDGLKEKLEEGGILSHVQLEVRDITTNSEWGNLYQYEIPVLARVRDDGVEEALPRIYPRLNAEQVQKKILGLLTSVA